jgi:hypothetical protein
VNLGKNKMARIATATTAPAASAARMTWVNLRGMPVPPFLSVDRDGSAPPRSSSSSWTGSNPLEPVRAGPDGAGHSALLPAQVRAMPKRSMPVAGKIVLQVAVRDIGQLTDIDRRAPR